MTDTFLTFQSFRDPALAASFAEQLRAQDIPVEVEETSPHIDPVIIGEGYDSDIKVKLRPEDFNKAHAVLEAYFQKELDDVDKDYYLFSFSNEELLSVIEKPFEWGALDYQLARRLLAERGHEISAESVQAIKASSLNELATPECMRKSWILLGYLFAIFFGPLGIIYGATIISLKKTLPNGERVCSYDQTTRRHGRTMLVIASTLTVVWILMEMV